MHFLNYWWPLITEYPNDGVITRTSYHVDNRSATYRTFHRNRGSGWSMVSGGAQARRERRAGRGRARRQLGRAAAVPPWPPWPRRATAPPDRASSPRPGPRCDLPAVQRSALCRGCARTGTRPGLAPRPT